jgi:glycerophosphoryl diester phosphodiesterase
VQAGVDPPDLRHVALQLPPSVGGVTVVDRRLVDVAHQRGLAVHVWTIEEEAEMEQLCELGVDGIMTDRPSALAGILCRRGIQWRDGPAGRPNEDE